MWKDTYYQQLEKDLLKKGTDHDGVFEDTWMNKKDEWLDYLGNDVLCTPFAYSRPSKGMEKITGFGMKKILTLPSLGWINFNSLRDENDEYI